ncbi:MAG: ABC transporter ATP-binding protein [Opitutaceae bacterium]|nr:ABC transporter ATP-binding protein [Opitutaceae bacterium]
MKPAPDQMDLLTLARRRRIEEGAAQFKPLEWGLIRRLWTYTRPHRRKRNLLVALTLVRSMQLPALAWAVGAIISGPVARHEPLLLAWAVAGYAVLALSTDALFHFRQRYALELGEAVVNALRADIFRHVQRMPMSFFHRTKVGRIISRVTSDVESVRIGIQDVLFVSTIQAGQVFFAGIVMLICDRVMFLMVLALAPVLWVLNRHFRVRLSHLSRASQESFSRVTATLAESVSGIRVTQGFARQETNAGLFRSLLADHARYNVALTRTSAILMPLLELNSQFFIALLLLLGGWRVMHGDMSLGRLIQFFFLVNQFFSPIQIIGNQYNQALTSMAGAERVFRLLDAQPDWEDAPDAAPLPDSRQAISERAGVGERELGRPAASVTRVLPSCPAVSSLPAAGRVFRGMRVEFRRVTFGYDPARPVLHDINLTAEPGQSVALVGHTGSGKSSLANLVAKFYLPTSGELLIDGREIRTISSHSLHRQMGLVQQQNFLFSGTVLENIRLGKPEATEAEVAGALRRLDCLDLIEALAGGLQTQVGERGGALSLGQRQVICFARALLAEPRLLILDEATSSIDTLTEARLQKALAALVARRTSLIVAHRLSTIRQADLILVLERGRIIERGPHASLLAKGGRYAALYRQFRDMDGPAA